MPKRKTQEEFLNDLSMTHNDTITTKDRYINNRNKLLFCCKVCGYTWKAIPRNVLHGAGCPNCKGGIRLTQREFLNKLKQVWGAKITTSDIYINSSAKLNFYCNICDKYWKATPGHILSGEGCPRCANKNRARAQTATQEEFLTRLRGVHGDKIITSDIYCGEKTRIKFHCNLCNNDWKAVPDHVLQGRGCPNCASSSGEQTVRAILEFNNIDYDPQHNFRIKGTTHRLDTVLKDASGTWCVIQPDGQQHFKMAKNFGGIEEFENRKQRDQEENKYLPALGVKVLRIPWFWFDLDNTFILLQNFLGYKLKKPDKDYVPKYKSIKNMVYKYLKEGNVKNVAREYSVSVDTVLDSFKKYFNMTRAEYVKLRPEYYHPVYYSSTSFRKTAVISIDDSGNIIRYQSISEASRQTGASTGNISNCLHGRQKTTGGYRWEYAN